MIAGVGTDITAIGRVARAYEKKAFRDRVYTKAEQELIGTRLSRAADNWAAKEAVAKAFGTGFGGLAPTEIEVLRDERGKPFVILYGRAQEQAKALGVKNCHISISNEKEYAVAFAVIQ